MKKFIAFITLFFAFLFSVDAQGYRPTIYTEQGKYIQFGGAAADTLIMNDTITYTFYVEHVNGVQPYIQTLYDKISSGNPSVTLSFSQSIDGTSFTPILKGAAQSAYTKALSPTADTYYRQSLIADTAIFEGRFLRLEYKTTNTPSTAVKAKIYGTIKFNIK